MWFGLLWALLWATACRLGWPWLSSVVLCGFGWARIRGELGWFGLGGMWLVGWRGVAGFNGPVGLRLWAAGDSGSRVVG